MTTKATVKKTTPAKKKKGDGQEKMETLNDMYLFQRGLMKASRTGAKFSHAVVKNLRALNVEIEDMENIIELSGEMKEYNKKVEELNREHALKDEEGEYILRDTVIQGEQAKIFRIPGKGDKTSTYGKALELLKKEYKEHIDAHQKEVDEYNEYIKDEPCTWEIPKMIDKKDVPDAAAPVMDAIIFMIKDE